MNLSRRRVLQLGSAGAVAAVLPTRAPARPTPRVLRSKPRATNLIFMVADGMSYGTLTLADACSREQTGKPSTWVSLFNEKGVRRSTAFTYSADSHVTDSAAGASVWGIGERVNNKCVNFTPDKRTPTPLHVHARQQGKATGLVTTTTITHATPAGFIANVPSRDLEKEIAIQQMERGFDVALGGGAMFFPESTLKLRPDVSVVRDAAALRAADPKKPVLGLFADGHVAYTLDRPPTQPDLEEMTRTALARLLPSPNGFLLLIEGGRVDHAAHANDAAALIHDQLAFDRAVAAVWELTRGRDDTLVIVTTDHGNANPALSKCTTKTGDRLKLLNNAKHSFEWILREAMGAVKDDDGVPRTPERSESALAKSAEHLAELIRSELGIALTADQRQTLLLAMEGKPVDPYIPRQSLTSVMGSLLANHTLVSFLSDSHTSDMVEVTSWGPGSDLIDPMINNFDLHAVALKALDLAPAKPV